MALSSDAAKQLLIATTNIKDVGNEVVTAINKGEAVATASLLGVVAVITAPSTSQTTGFGALAVGDKIFHVGASPSILTCATAGTLPVAAVLNDIYLVLRPIVFPAASAVKF